MRNKEIESLFKKSGVFKWEVARKLGIHEGTFSRWFRDPLTDAQTKAIIAAIEEVKLDRLKAQD